MIEVGSLEILYKFLLAASLGALIGIEREKSHQMHKGTDFAGIRTFMLISFMGAVSAYLSTIFSPMFLPVIFVCFVVVILAGYIFSSYYNKDIGMTTALSTLLAFLIGLLAFTVTEEIPIIIAISVTLILSFKSYLHQFVYNLKSHEFFDTMKFLVVAFVILPLLKHVESFGPYDSINLYEIWLMVVFVSGLSFIGYVLIKLFGAKSGIVLTGFLGGVLSSTAVVTTLAEKSKEQEKESNAFVFSAALACSTMFLRLLIEVGILNFSILEKLTFPLIIMAIAGYLSVSVLWKQTSNSPAEMTFKSPLMLKPALKFGFFYGFVIIIANILSAYMGSKGLLVAALISGIADVDAITIFVARNPDIAGSVGITAIIIASIVNTIVKIFIAKSFGTAVFGKGLMKALLPIIIVGLLLVIFL